MADAAQTRSQGVMRFEEFIKIEPKTSRKAYKPRKEKISSGNAFHDLDHANINSKLTKFGEEVCELIGHVGAQHGSELYSLKTSATNTTRVKYGEGKRVAFIGEAGEGKSTMIKQILGLNLHLTDIGSPAFPHVVVSYHHLDIIGEARHSTQIRAEVDLFAQQDIDALIFTFTSEMRAAYENDSSDQRNHAVRQARHLLNVMYSLTRTDSNYDGSTVTSYNAVMYRAAEAFAADMNVLANDAIMRIMADEHCDERSLDFQCQDAASLSARIGDYAKGRRSCLVKNIRVYVGHMVLEHGCVMVELPALNDDNILRRFATGKNRSADAYMIVARLCDVASKSSVQKELKTAIMLAPNGAKDVFLIITHVDNPSNWETHTRNLIEVSDNKPFLEIKMALAANDMAILNVTRQAHRDNDESESWKEESTLMSPEVEQRKRYEAYLEHFADKASIAQEISETEMQLKKWFVDQGGQSVNVLMAAPLEHDRLVNPSRMDTRLPLFTPEETGLPTIRRWLKTMNTDTRLNHLHRHIEENVGLVLSKLQNLGGHVSDVGSATPIDAAAIVKLYKSHLEAITKSLIHFLENSFTSTKIIEEGRFAHVQKKISKEAMGKWFPESLQPNTLRAILKYGGTYQTQTNEKTKYNWNFDVVKVLQPYLSIWIGQVAVEINKEAPSVTSKLERLKHDTVTLIRSGQYPLGMVALSLASIHEIDKSVSKLFHNFLHDAKQNLRAIIDRVVAMDEKIVGTMPPNHKTGSVGFHLAAELHSIEKEEWTKQEDVQADTTPNVAKRQKRTDVRPKKMIIQRSVKGFIESASFLDEVLQDFTQDVINSTNHELLDPLVKEVEALMHGWSVDAASWNETLTGTPISPEVRSNIEDALRSGKLQELNTIYQELMVCVKLEPLR